MEGRTSRGDDGVATPPPPSDAPDFSLSRSQRLTHSRHLQEAFDQSEVFSGRMLVIRLRRGEGAALRLGVVASRRSFRRAVDRARVKRLMREAFRLNRHRLRGDCDVVLMARTGMLRASRQDVEVELMAVARKARLVDRAAGGPEHAAQASAGRRP